jgi:hypothetical protein
MIGFFSQGDEKRALSMTMIAGVKGIPIGGKEPGPISMITDDPSPKGPSERLI